MFQAAFQIAVFGAVFFWLNITVTSKELKLLLLVKTDALISQAEQALHDGKE